MNGSISRLSCDRPQNLNNTLICSEHTISEDNAAVPVAILLGGIKRRYEMAGYCSLEKGR